MIDTTPIDVSAASDWAPDTPSGYYGGDDETPLLNTVLAAQGHVRPDDDAE